MATLLGGHTTTITRCHYTGSGRLCTLYRFMLGEVQLADCDVTASNIRLKIAKGSADHYPAD
ncbi:hypothetical protein J6590_036448 [Homalodisca vitripennis]|nr:hypothetical protein J6590_036448 [Homalodisca vitripennis]